MSLLSSLGRLPQAHLPWLAVTCSAALGGLVLWNFGFESGQIRKYAAYFLASTLFYYLEEFLKVIADPQEPPLVPCHGLPLVGHPIGMFKYGARYFDMVNAKTNYPIYTLQTLTGRTIVVISPHLAGPIQRASKNLSFYGMILEVTARLIDLNEETMAVLRDNLNRENGDHGIMHESHAMVASVLSPGPILNSMSGVQFGKFSELLNEMFAGDTALKISLNGFVKNVFTTANAFTIYGPKNPFALYPELVDQFWAYEAGMIPLLANIFPSVTARKPYLARKAVNAALQEFVETEMYKSASPLIQKRVAISLKYGLTTEMAGHAELIMLFGILGNAVPTTFWFLTNVFSRPELLAQIRDETAAAVSIVSPTEKIINVTKLKTACPLLVSTYREILRTIANLASVRLVVNSHTVSSTTPLSPFPSSYLLRKGGMIQIASGVIHASESVWGPDAKSFNPTRFIFSSTNTEQFSSATNISAERTASQLPKNVPSAAYRAFGGGSVICPGRHFAQSEILGFVALCVHMFDIEGEDGGPVPCPRRDDSRIPLSVMKPDAEPEVMIKKRTGEEGVAWGLEV